MKLFIVGDFITLFGVFSYLIATYVNNMINYDTLYLKPFELTIYFIFSSGVIGVLLTIKCIYGVRFIWRTTGIYKSRVKAREHNSTKAKSMFSRELPKKRKDTFLMIDSVDTKEE